MPVTIAEYLGQRTDVDTLIIPILPGTNPICPFMDRTCDKASKSKPVPPVCSVRKQDGTLWIVCEHRLCSTRQKKIQISDGKNKEVRNKLIDHQKDILLKVAKVIYQDPMLTNSEIGVRREVNIPLADTDIDTELGQNTKSKKGFSYHADYVMRNFSGRGRVDEVLLEMQGGGETSNTGNITDIISAWRKSPTPTNTQLRQIAKASPLETNAWRRQQEQFLVKGNVVDQTGGKIVFAVGSLLYDYLYRRFKKANLRNLKSHNWTLCILAFIEDKSLPIQPGPIPLTIDEEKTLFTNYSTFVRFLTDQGAPCPELFEGAFLKLDDTIETIAPSN